MAGEALELALNLTGNLPGQAATFAASLGGLSAGQVATGAALSTLETRAQSLADRLQMPLKSSTYRDLQSQIEAAGGRLPVLTAAQQAATGAINDGAAAATKSAAALASEASANDAAAKAASAHAAASKSGAESGAKFNLSTREGAGGIGALTGAMQTATSVVNGGTGAMDLATGALSKMGQYGAAAAAALQLVVAVLTVVVEKLYEFVAAAVKVVQQREALTATFAALGGGAKAGEATMKMVEELSKKLPFTVDKLDEMAKNLEKAGFAGAELKRATEAVATSAAIMRDGGAAATTLLDRLKTLGETGQKVTLDRRMLTMLESAGVSLKNLAAQLGVPESKLGKMSLSAEKLSSIFQQQLAKTGGGALAAMGNTWSVIWSKALDGIMSMFEHVKPEVDGLMSALGSFFGMFNRGTATNKLGADLVTNALHKIIPAITAMVKFARHAFIQTEIAILTVSTALKKYKSVWDSLGALAPLPSPIPSLDQGDAAAKARAGGKAVADGGADGVMAGIPAFVAANLALAQAGQAAFDSAYQIKSPSRVMTKRGKDYIAGAAASGVADGAGKMQDAMAKLAPQSPSKGGSGGGAKKPAKERPSVTFSGCTFGREAGTVEEEVLIALEKWSNA